MIVFAFKNFLIIIGIVLTLFVGIAIGKGTKLNHTAPTGNLAANLAAEPDIKPAPNAIKEIVSKNNPVTDEVASDGVEVKVIRVIDGDTIEIEGGETIRYIGIDTPETVDPRKPIQCFGVEASNKNKELVEGKITRLEKDVTDRDKYNRLLRYVWVGDTFVNLELVKRGFAYSYSYPPDVKYQDQFIKAQQEARENKLGLWNACPIVQDQVATSAASAQTAIFLSQKNNSGGSCLIKGNINSSGEKIYHLTGCPYYEKTKIDIARGEKWFCAESEALALGWRKALNCP